MNTQQRGARLRTLSMTLLTLGALFIIVSGLKYVTSDTLQAHHLRYISVEDMNTLSISLMKGNVGKVDDLLVHALHLVGGLLMGNGIMMLTLTFWTFRHGRSSGWWMILMCLVFTTLPVGWMILIIDGPLWKLVLVDLLVGCGLLLSWQQAFDNLSENSNVTLSGICNKCGEMHYSN